MKFFLSHVRWLMNTLTSVRTAENGLWIERKTRNNFSSHFLKNLIIIYIAYHLIDDWRISKPTTRTWQRIYLKLYRQENYRRISAILIDCVSAFEITNSNYLISLIFLSRIYFIIRKKCHPFSKESWHFTDMLFDRSRKGFSCLHYTSVYQKDELN